MSILPKLEPNSYYDEELVLKTIKSSPNEKQARDIINSIHQVLTKPLTTIAQEMDNFKIYLNSLSIETAPTSSKEQVRKLLSESYLGSMIMTAINTLNVSNEDLDEMIIHIKQQRANILKQKQQEANQNEKPI